MPPALIAAESSAEQGEEAEGARGPQTLAIPAMPRMIKPGRLLGRLNVNDKVRLNDTKRRCTSVQKQMRKISKLPPWPDLKGALGAGPPSPNPC